MTQPGATGSQRDNGTLAATSGSTTSTTTTRPTTPSSLIKRLGLQDRIDQEFTPVPRAIDVKGKGKAVDEIGEDDESSSTSKVQTTTTNKTGWQTSAQAREQSLKERKAKMVLEARRKLLEKEQRTKAER
ncbi:hypothetical protein OIV83_004827 [Microbotryomycetes sp. JL201]|nr:hypothetical protein OIV83_004827 [Microbotryomycetes sp. JL201]